jgi:hypothetical protein
MLVTTRVEVRVAVAVGRVVQCKGNAGECE